MKCIVGVISSEGPGFQTMKEVWKKNVSTFNNCGSGDSVELYFLEGKQRNDNDLYHVEEIEENIYSFQANCKETFENILRKSIIFFKHVAEFDTLNEKGEFTFVMRSNLSTLFDFHKLFNYLYEVNSCLHTNKREHFIGGSIIDKYCSLQTYFSGTNITLSIPVIRVLIQYYKRMILDTIAGDDVVLSGYAIKLCFDKLVMRDIPRMDFCGEITFNSCGPFDNSVFCYRFKSSDRSQDSTLMNNFLENMNSIKDLKELFFYLYEKKLFNCNGFLNVKNPGYKNTFTKPFILHHYTYRDTQVIYPEFF
jgi:hypothetical protein